MQKTARTDYGFAVFFFRYVQAGASVQLQGGFFKVNAESCAQHFQRCRAQFFAGENADEVQFAGRMMADAPDVCDVKSL